MRRLGPLISKPAPLPRGLMQEQAAKYVGVDEATFLELIKRGQMPKPGDVAGIEIWDRRKIDAAFERLMFVRDESPLDWSKQPVPLRPWFPPEPAEGEDNPIKEVVDRRGFVRLLYVRPDRAKIRLPKCIGSEKFRKAYEKAEADYREFMAVGHDTGVERTATLEWLCDQYFDSIEFKTGLNEATGAARRRRLQNLCGFLNDAGERYGKTAYAEFKASDLRVVRRKLGHTPGMANEYVKCARGLFRFASNKGLVDENTALQVDLYQLVKEARHSWNLSEIHQYQQTHAIGSQARLALDLALYTGQRRADLVSLGPPHECEGWLVFTQRKNQRSKPSKIEIPIAPELRRSIDATPIGSEFYLTTRDGSSMGPDWLSIKFSRWCEEANVPKRCTLHGIRKAMAARMASLGVLDRDIMAVTGHRSRLEVDRYTRSAHQRMRAVRALERLNYDIEHSKNSDFSRSSVS